MSTSATAISVACPKAGPTSVYHLTSPFWQFVDHWQTLITGILALLAAVATIGFTMTAAKWQLDAAKTEINVTLNLERRRNLREGFAFHMMLQAVAQNVIEDVAAARRIAGNGSSDVYSTSAFEARQRIKKAAFDELHSAAVRLGGSLTAPLLRLDRLIDAFSSEFRNFPGTSAGILVPMGVTTGLLDQLTKIELQASALVDEATMELKRLSEHLAEPR